MPRLVCTFQRFIEIIEAHGFAQIRHGATSHRRYRGMVNGRVCLVDVAYHNIRDEVRTGTLKSMIRQSGLPASLFRR